MGELREWITLLLSPVLIPVFFAARKGWQQWQAKREASRKLVRRETRRADTYEAAGTEAFEALEFENQELQLENEALESRNLSLTESVAKLADAYKHLADQKAVEL